MKKLIFSLIALMTAMVMNGQPDFVTQKTLIL